ncbi:MAG: 2-hydroxychromene-2-carboxylate isomerase [Archangium sp.]
MAVEFWFDFASTYSYVGAMRVEALCRENGVALTWRPFLLGPIFTQQLGIKDSPFNTQPLRAKYMWRDLERLSAKYGLPFVKPSTFPQRSILAARVACAALNEAWLGDFIRGVFHAQFGEARDIASADVLKSVLLALGVDADVWLAAAERDEVKLQLRAFTDEAARRGIFGAPNMFVGDEHFFGQDRLDDALHFARAAK